MPTSFTGNPSGGFSIDEMRGLLESILGRQTDVTNTAYDTAGNLADANFRGLKQASIGRSASFADQALAGAGPGGAGLMAGDPLKAQELLRETYYTQALPSLGMAMQQGNAAKMGLETQRAGILNSILGQGYQGMQSLWEIKRQEEAKREAETTGGFLGKLLKTVSPFLALIPGWGL